MISIIIPAFNEADRIRRSLEQLQKFLKNRSDKFEVIFVDDASTDNTREIAESFTKKIPELKILHLDKSPFAGKGLAVNKGMLEAKGDISIFTDADFSTPIEELDKLVEKLNSGYDIAIGSRAIERSTVKKRQPLLREYMGRIFNILVQNLAVRGIVDTQCGFKAFKMPVCRQLFESERVFDFGFDVELLYLAKRRGLKIAEVPVLWYNNPRSSVNPIKDSIAMFLDLLKIRMYHSNKEGPPIDRLFYCLYTYRTFWRFSTVGVSNTIVDYGLFYLLTRFVSLHALVANPISVEIAILWSFVWNNAWTFSERKVKDPLINRFFIFQAVSLGGLVLSQLFLLFFNEFLNIYDLIAKALIIPIVLIFNYILNSRWTFRDVSQGKTKWYGYIAFILSILAIYLILTYRLSASF